MEPSGDLRVLHCRSSISRHGPERALLELLPALEGRGVHVELLALYRAAAGGPTEHPWVREATAMGLTANQLADPSALSVRVVRRLAWRLRRSGAGVLHTHDYRTNILGGLVARRVEGTVPWVATVHLHTTATRRLRLYRAVDLFLLRLADRVITVSRDQRRLLLRRGVDRRRLVLLPNVIDADAFAAGAAPRHATRAALGIGPRVPVVTLVGRLSPQKGVDVLVDAAPRLLAAVPDALFLVAGGGIAKEALEARARGAGLDGRFRFLGYRSDVASLLAASDVVAIASRSEGLPLVLLEAMAVGRPVVATAVGGVPDLVRDGEHGWLVDPDRPAALARALETALLDEAAARARGEAASRQVRLMCAPDRAARRLAEEYRAVLAERG